MTCLFCMLMAMGASAGKQNERSCSRSHHSRTPSDRRRGPDDLRAGHKPRTHHLGTASSYRSPDRRRSDGPCLPFLLPATPAPPLAKILEEVGDAINGQAGAPFDVLGQLGTRFALSGVAGS